MGLFRQKERRSSAPTIGDEAEAFAHGGLHEFWTRRGIEVGSWLQLNRLAHGTAEDLQALAVGHWKGRGPEERWCAGLAFAAHEVLQVVTSDDDLRTLQQEVLWPLEEDFISAPRSLTTATSDLCLAVARATEEREHR